MLKKIVTSKPAIMVVEGNKEIKKQLFNDFNTNHKEPHQFII